MIPSVILNKNDVYIAFNYFESQMYNIVYTIINVIMCMQKGTYKQKNIRITLYSTVN